MKMFEPAVKSPLLKEKKQPSDSGEREKMETSEPAAKRPLPKEEKEPTDSSARKKMKMFEPAERPLSEREKQFQEAGESFRKEIEEHFKKNEADMRAQIHRKGITKEEDINRVIERTKTITHLGMIDQFKKEVQQLEEAYLLEKLEKKVKKFRKELEDCFKEKDEDIRKQIREAGASEEGIKRALEEIKGTLINQFEKSVRKRTAVSNKTPSSVPSVSPTL